MLRRLVLAALSLACIVIVLGAYVRLSDAGLGCPDWPGCYGQLSPHHAAEAISAAQADAPQGPVSMPKAWKEMVHRYLAATLGLMILCIAVLTWRRRREGAPLGLAAALVGVVIFQGLLGKWTVTLLLKPAIVSGHLIGGMTTAALLAWLACRLAGLRRIDVPPAQAWLARAAFLALACQVVLGGWVSTNYAALACADLPTCHGQWWPETDFHNAFHLVRELGMTASGDLLSHAALTAIHLSHRVGALVAGALLAALAIALLRRTATRGLGALLLAALVLQISLGVANVLLSLPLPLAVMHNAGALMLVLVMVRINHAVRPRAVVVRRGRCLNENALA